MTAAQTGEEVASLNNEFDTLSETIGKTGSSVNTLQLTTMVISLWVVIVTVALVVIGVLSFRRWRRDYFMDGSLANVPSSAQSSSDLSDSLGSDIGNLMEAGLGGPEGASNSGFQSDDSLSVSVDLGESAQSPSPHRTLAGVHQQQQHSPPFEDSAPDTSDQDDGTRL